MNTYDEVVNWLYVQLPNYQRQGGPAYKPGLDTIKKLLKGLGNPQEFFRSVHIAGTNGKGSVTHMLAAIFQENGYKTGIFTSPHISDFRERIKINGQMVPKEFVTGFVLKNKELIASTETTFFEITTAMAFEAFREYEVDIAIVETGMGGRLDSTNVLLPELAVITNIGLDHTKYLGSTIPEVAAEKAGIIKENVPVLIGERQPETTPVFEKYAAARSAPLRYTKEVKIDTDLWGVFQRRNITTAWAAYELLKDKFKLNEEISRKALRHVASLTGFQGRFQRIGEQPNIFVDAAHNFAGIENLFDEIRGLYYKKLHLIYGASNDKDLDQIFTLFPTDATYYFAGFQSERSTTPATFRKMAKSFSLNATYHNNALNALKAAKSVARPDDLVVVFGSFFILEDVLKS